MGPRAGAEAGADASGRGAAASDAWPGDAEHDRLGQRQPWPHPQLPQRLAKPLTPHTSIRSPEPKLHCKRHANHDTQCLLVAV